MFSIRQLTGHWSQVTCDDPNLFTGSTMETPGFSGGDRVIGRQDWVEKMHARRSASSMKPELCADQRVNLGMAALLDMTFSL